MDMHRLPGTPRQQRRSYIEMVLARAPAARPGAQYIYANSGYSVAAVIAEEAMDMPWEQIMRRMLFEPLGMKTAGFGAMGSPGKIDQPWPHKKTPAGVSPVEPGRFSDNPPVIGPGGTVHCSLADWARFIQVHLGRGGTLLERATIEKLHEPGFGGSYACGWQVTERAWGGGKVLTHAGTNTMNYAVAWVAPLKNYAVLVATNQGGGTEAQACDAVAVALVRSYPPAGR
jgi:CubicO group peptidase (beta-lactamase class C family)